MNPLPQAPVGPDECWKFFRFRKEDLENLFRLLELHLHLVIKGDKNGSVTGTFACLVLLYRLRYPTTLSDNLHEFGCDYSKMSKIFNTCLDFLYDRHAYKVLTNVAWYSDRFDMYHEVYFYYATSFFQIFPLTYLHKQAIINKYIRFWNRSKPTIIIILKINHILKRWFFQQATNLHAY